MIPSNVVELRDEWCYRADNLKKISVMPKNPNFLYFDNKYIIGKSNPESEDFDVLHFARRDIQEVKIPSFIKIIASCALDQCREIRSIQFAEDSKLKIIGKHSFSCSSIESILIPSHVTSIEKGAFFTCLMLNQVDFPDDSELLAIKDEAFLGSSIEYLSIPSSLTTLEESWCWGTPCLINIKLNPNNQNFHYYHDKFIFGKSNQKSEFFDVLLFSRRDVRSAKIPSFIKRIAPYAFNDYIMLKKVEFRDDSELEIIDKSAFFGSSLEKIIIPRHVTKIM